MAKKILGDSDIVLGPMSVSGAFSIRPEIVKTPRGATRLRFTLMCENPSFSRIMHETCMDRVKADGAILTPRSRRGSPTTLVLEYPVPKHRSFCERYLRIATSLFIDLRSALPEWQLFEAILESATRRERKPRLKVVG